ncbi:expressed unknown protein [Seminavis robusta]|uniref:Uncharacterized protein n=1 Tax=Seminavis robusta TaxID=568900 RepID=A0A9N8E5U6_9STRA|nr:expressed unknown protein [Seminavis robusta]|eukprot:Sro651_g181600.1 n/a (1014) ;mRNA; f:38605-41762
MIPRFLVCFLLLPSVVVSGSTVSTTSSKKISGGYFSLSLKAQASTSRGSSGSTGNLRGLQDADDDFFDDVKDNMNMNNNNDINNNMDNGEFPDDEYHCRDPELVEEAFWKDKTVQCDWDTHEWILDKLDEDEIPEHCIDEEFEFQTVKDLRDWQEPCYLWMTLYGELAPSTAPSPAPSDPTPSIPGTIHTMLPFGALANTTTSDSNTTAPTADASTLAVTTTGPTSQQPSEAMTTSPTSSPIQLTSSPTQSPTPAPSETTTDAITGIPTLEPTAAVTSEPSAEPTPAVALEITSIPHLDHEYTHDFTEEAVNTVQANTPLVPMPTPDKAPTRTYPPVTLPAITPPMEEYSPAGPHIYEIPTMVMTYLIDPARRRNLIWMHMDRDVLEDVTASHVETEIRRSLTFWWEQQPGAEQQGPLQVAVDVSLTSVRSFLLPNETMVATEALSGVVSVLEPSNGAMAAKATTTTTVVVNQPQVKWPESIEEQMEAAFHGNALRRYVRRLKTSSDPILQRTDYIEVGLPLDLLASNTNNVDTTNTNIPPNNPASSTNPNDNVEAATVWSVGGVEFSLTTLAIIAGSIALFSIFLLLCVCWKLRAIRKQQQLDELNLLPTSTKPSHSTEEGSEGDDNNNDKNKNKKSRRTLRGNKKGKGVKEEESVAERSAETTTNDPTNRYYQRYVAETDDRSLATSTYSYLDSNLHGNGGISLAPSYLYGNDDASLQSKAMWSLIDGITNQGDEEVDVHPDANYTYDQTASPSMSRPVASSSSGAVKTPDANFISPRNMTISTIKRDSTNPLSYDEETDNLSLTSMGGGISYADRVSFAAASSAESPMAAEPKTEPANTPTDNAPTTEDHEARNMAYLGMSARKKKNSIASSSSNSGGGCENTTGSVRKAIGQLTSCASSSKDRREDEEPIVMPAPSDEVGSPPLRSTSVSSKDAADSTIQDLHHRLGDSTMNSKNSGLLPDKLFPDDTIESGATNTSSSKVGVTATVMDTSKLLKDGKGQYVIDSMSSF